MPGINEIKPFIRGDVIGRIVIIILPTTLRQKVGEKEKEMPQDNECNFIISTA